MKHQPSNVGRDTQQGIPLPLVQRYIFRYISQIPHQITTQNQLNICQRIIIDQIVQL